MRPFIYDFKRSFVRVSTITLLVLFVLAGVGFGYLIGRGVKADIPMKYSIVGVLVGNTVEGIVIGPHGNPSPGVKVELIAINSVINQTVSLVEYSNSSGYVKFIINESFLSPEELVLHEENGKNATISLVSPFKREVGTIILLSPAIIFNYSFIYASPYTLLQQQGAGFPVCALIANYYPNGSLRVYLANTMPDYFYYGIEPLGSSQSSALTPLDHLGVGIYSLILNVGKLTPGRAYQLVFKTSSNQTFSFYFTSLTPYISEEEVSSVIFNISTFVTYFPIIFLYLAYVLIAKPKNYGALDFLFSMPITRGEIFISRYLGGILTALASTALLFIASYLTLSVIVGVTINGLVFLYLFLGVFLSLISFYGLMLLLATLFNSSSAYMAISILVYILFTFIETLVFAILEFMGYDIAKYEAYLSYNAPMNFLSYIAYKMVGASPPSPLYLNPPLEIATAILWIALPTALAYLKFTEYFKVRKLIRSGS
ncbi:MAG: ABC transporter permease subunit [Sulfolobaceae archaeon]|nr:ABC transporter permease subunit [Sulfolobaceae archaeon]